MQLGMISYI